MNPYLLLILFALVVTGCGSIQKATVAKKVGDNSRVGVEEYKKGNLASAQIFFEQALKDAYSVDNIDEAINVLQNMSEVYLDLQKYDEASNSIFTAKLYADNEAISNNYFTVYLTIAKYYEKTGKSDSEYLKAWNACQSALALAKNDPDKALVYYRMGSIKISQNKPDEAVEYIDKAKKINESTKNYGDLADNYYILGTLSEQKGQKDKAIENYSWALQYDKAVEDSLGIFADLKKLGELNAANGKKDDAIYYYKRALNTADSLNMKAEVEDIRKKLSDMGA